MTSMIRRKLPTGGRTTAADVDTLGKTGGLQQRLTLQMSDLLERSWVEKGSATMAVCRSASKHETSLPTVASRNAPLQALETGDLARGAGQRRKQSRKRGFPVGWKMGYTAAA